jgi:hypothetical protein
LVQISFHSIRAALAELATVPETPKKARAHEVEIWRSCMSSETIERLCNLPLDRNDTMSLADLLKRSGYLSESTPIAREKIVAHLRDRPELIDAWRILSDDQRTRQGWVFRPSPDGSRVYLYPDGPSMKFQDKFEACAEFILRYAALLASHLKGSSNA